MREHAQSSSADTGRVIHRPSLIHIRNGLVLVVRAQENNKWELPGGKNEPGEGDKEALRREIGEEINATVLPSSMKDYGVFKGSAIDKPKGTVIELICFTADLRGKIKPGYPEIEDYDFFSSKQLQALKPIDQIVLQRLKDEGKID